jgi:hypothetical protein
MDTLHGLLDEGSGISVLQVWYECPCVNAMRMKNKVGL